MASWDELRETMRQSYKLQQDEADLVSMVWTYDDGRHQKVILRHYKAFDRSLVEFQSAFARIEDLNPTEALRKNAELPLGTIALQGEVYVVLYNAVLDDLGPGSLELYLSRVAGIADQLEETYGRKDVF